MNILDNIFSNKSYSTPFITLIIVFIVFVTYYFCIKCNTFTFKGGSMNDNSELTSMVKNGLLTDKQKMNELKEKIKKAQIKVKKYNTIYNNLLTNLSSNEEEIQSAEIDLEEVKNNLSLAETNLALKNSMIILKNNKNPKKIEHLEFNVALNKSKQYNIQTIISLHKTKQLRKNTLVSPKDILLKTELLKSIDDSLKYSQQAYIKAKHVYTLCIGSTNPNIVKYKNDLSNSKNIAKDLEDNITNIKNRIEEKYKLQDSIKEKLQIQKTTTANKIIYDQQIPTNTPTVDNNQTKKIIEDTINEQQTNTSEQNVNSQNTTILDTISNIFNF